MRKLMKIMKYIFPFDNNIKNILLYLSLSPIINCILTNIYYYNCGGYIGEIMDVISLLNPFNSCNYLCYVIATLMTMNLYIKSYIFYIMMIFLITLFI